MKRRNRILRARLALAAMTLLCVMFVLASCVTPGDIQRVADTTSASMERINDRIVEMQTNPEVTAEDVAATITQAKEDIADEVEVVIADIQDRTGQVWTDISNLGPAGIGSLIAIIGTNYWRNTQRRKRGEPVAIAPPLK